MFNTAGSALPEQLIQGPARDFADGDHLFPLMVSLLCDTSVIASMLYCARKQKTEAVRPQNNKNEKEKTIIWLMSVDIDNSSETDEKYDKTHIAGLRCGESPAAGRLFLLAV